MEGSSRLLRLEDDATIGKTDVAGEASVAQHFTSDRLLETGLLKRDICVENQFIFLLVTLAHITLA